MFMLLNCAQLGNMLPAAFHERVREKVQCEAFCSNIYSMKRISFIFSL